MSRPRIKARDWSRRPSPCWCGLSGCDLQENADTANGRQLFIANCGTCHALKEAGTTGNIGPDLDAAFADARAAGMDQDTIEGVVTAQIAQPRDTDPDRPDLHAARARDGRDADDVAAYVGSVAGVPGIEPPTAPGGPGGQVFADNGCGSCHTFAAAESPGAVGPNLDDGLPGQTAAKIETASSPRTTTSPRASADIMPQNYGDTIEAKDLKLLVDFLYENAGKNRRSSNQAGPSGRLGGPSAGSSSSGAPSIWPSQPPARQSPTAIAITARIAPSVVLTRTAQAITITAAAMIITRIRNASSSDWNGLRSSLSGTRRMIAGARCGPADRRHG